RSIDAYLAYQKSFDFNQLEDMGRIEAYLRETVVVHTDGTLSPRVTPDVETATFAALLHDRRDYLRVHAPALAIYAHSMMDLHVGDSQRRALWQKWEDAYMVPFREKSIERLRREIKGSQIVRVPGAHDSFFLTERGEVVSVIRQFLLE